jgi:SAM-dependent methyltransferase
VEQPVTPPAVKTEISPNDLMYRSNPDGYFPAGMSALAVIERAMAASGTAHVGRILDMGCGHGRVLRALATRFAGAELVACDIDRDGVDYCAEHFGARPVYASTDPSALSLAPDSFDLVWCGSLATHLSFGFWTDHLDRLVELLTGSGVLVFSLHGRFVAHRLRTRSVTYGLDELQIRHVLDGFRLTGFGYVDYQPGADYGLSLTAPSWVCRQLEQRRDLRLIGYEETGWNHHQDVVSCVRENW